MTIAIMKFSVAVLCLASVAYSQTIASELAKLPTCSITCLHNAISGAGCSLTDYTCQCGTAKSAITTAATPCIISACSTSDALLVQSISAEICTLQAASSPSGASSTLPAQSASSGASTIGPSAASSAGASRTTSTLQSTSSNTAINSPTSTPSGTLDSGAKIGIGVGVAGGVIAIIAVVGSFFVLRKRRTSVPHVQGETRHELESESKLGPVEVPANIHHVELP